MTGETRVAESSPVLASNICDRRLRRSRQVWATRPGQRSRFGGWPTLPSRCAMQLARATERLFCVCWRPVVVSDLWHPSPVTPANSGAPNSVAVHVAVSGWPPLCSRPSGPAVPLQRGRGDQVGADTGVAHPPVGVDAHLLAEEVAGAFDEAIRAKWLNVVGEGYDQAIAGRLANIGQPDRSRHSDQFSSVGADGVFIRPGQVLVRHVLGGHTVRMREFRLTSIEEMHRQVTRLHSVSRRWA